MSSDMSGLSFLGALLQVAVMVALFVAVMRISSATRSTADNARRLAMMALAIMGHHGIRMPEPPCRQCGKRGKVVELERVSATVFKCPQCGGVRRL